MIERLTCYSRVKFLCFPILNREKRFTPENRRRMMEQFQLWRGYQALALSLSSPHSKSIL